MFNPYYVPYYQPAYQPQTIPQAMPDTQSRSQQTVQRQSPDERIWVQGEIGAKAFLVLPNNTVPLWDSESQTIWLKSVNAAGVPTMTKLSYIIDNAPPAHSGAVPSDHEYITRTEFEKRIQDIMKPTEVNDERSGSDVR